MWVVLIHCPWYIFWVILLLARHECVTGHYSPSTVSHLTYCEPFVSVIRHHFACIWQKNNTFAENIQLCVLPGIYNNDISTTLVKVVLNLKIIIHVLFLTFSPRIIFEVTSILCPLSVICLPTSFARGAVSGGREGAILISKQWYWGHVYWLTLGKFKCIFLILLLQMHVLWAAHWLLSKLSAPLTWAHSPHLRQ